MAPCLMLSILCLAVPALSISHVSKVNLRSDVSPGDVLHPERPRILFSEGCSMSSIIYNIAGELSAIHGLILNGLGEGLGADEFKNGNVVWESEALKPSKNPFYSQKDGMGKAIETANNITQQQLHTTLAFKVITNILFAEQDGVTWDEVLPTIKKLEARFVHTYRSNMLDVLTCKIKDCFYKNETTYGSSVDIHGQPSGDCFDRRSTNTLNKNTMAHINVDKDADTQRPFVVASIEYEENRVSDAMDKFRAEGLSVESISADELLDFEISGSLATSTAAWSKLLRSWGVDPDTNKIEEYLRGKQKEAIPTHSQREAIYNYDEVVKALSAGPDRKYTHSNWILANRRPMIEDFD